MYKRLLLSLFFLQISICNQTVFCKSSLASIPEQQSTNLSSTATTSPIKPPLQGNVQKVELDLGILRDVGLDLKFALEATSSLYEEVTIQPVRLITQPQMIVNGSIIHIPVGVQPVGPPQPARKERVDIAIGEMKPIIDLLKKNADQFVSGEKQLALPDDVIAKLQPQLQNWINIVNVIAADQAQLEQITKAPPYNNGAIANLAAAIEKNIKDLDKTRLAIYKVIRKEGKRISSSKG